MILSLHQVIGDPFSTPILPPPNPWPHPLNYPRRLWPLLHDTPSAPKRWPRRGRRIGARNQRHRRAPNPGDRRSTRRRPRHGKTGGGSERSWRAAGRVTKTIRGLEKEVAATREEEEGGGRPPARCDWWASTVCRIEAEWRSSSTASGGRCATTFSPAGRARWCVGRSASRRRWRWWRGRRWGRRTPASRSCWTTWSVRAGRGRCWTARGRGSGNTTVHTERT